MSTPIKIKTFDEFQYGLLIESSTERVVYGIAKGQEILYAREWGIGQLHAQQILEDLQAYCNRSDFTLKQLDYIGVGKGPGSYTGIRVGVVIAKTLAYALAKPLIGISTLQCFLPSQEGVFVAAIDARSGGVYALKGKWSLGACAYYTEPSLLELSEFEKFVRDAQVVVGPNFKNLKERLKESDGSVLNWEEKAPSLAHMLNQVKLAYQAEGFASDYRLDILYLRKTQAEIEAEQKQQVNL